MVGVQDVRELAEQVDALLRRIEHAEREAEAEIAACHPGNRPGAINLVHYTELRQIDLRELQGDLMDIGVSSLATTEANVRAKLHAARAALRALDGEPGPWDLQAVDDAIDEGDDLLYAHAENLLGPLPDGRTTRIMVTLPSEAVGDPSLVRALVERGMDVARINCAHDDHDAWAAMARHVREAAADAGRPVRVYVDLGGPKLRTGPIAAGPAVARVRPQRDSLGRPVAPGLLWLTAHASEPPPAGAVAVPVDLGWISRRSCGDVVSFTDTRGRSRGFEVVEVRGGGVLAAGTRTAYLVPGTELLVGDDASGVGPLPERVQRLRLHTGDTLVVTRDLAPVDPAAVPQRIGCTLPAVFGAAQVGQRILFDDGEIEGLIEQTGQDELVVRVTRARPGGKRLGAEKGINLPDTDLPVSAITPADEDALSHVVRYADVVGLSFVRSPSDVALLRERLHANGGRDVGIVLKVETAQCFARLPAILLDAMRWSRVGVMIARGDLMTEIGWERMSEVPHQILSLCEAGHLPVIWATQVLESLAKQGLPSRAEILDAAEGGRAECVMLNKGAHILEAVTTLDAVLRRMRRVQRKSRSLLRRITSWS
jgi:pyruvate kinase